MPRLGNPMEPAHGATVDPWWRSVSGEGSPAPVDVPVPDDADAPVKWPVD
jgi:hypothetical protein